MPVAINAPPLPGGNDYDYTYDRVMECLGSRENRDSFVILNHDIHNAKTQVSLVVLECSCTAVFLTSCFPLAVVDAGKRRKVQG